MTATVVSQAAELLRRAQEERTSIEPLTALFPGQLDVATAWQIQKVNRDRALAAGRSVVGYKIGLTSVAMQEQMGVDEPDFGVLLDDMLIADGGTLRLADYVQARAEAEIALVLDRELGAGATRDDVRTSVAAAYPALEIIDSRIKDWQLSLIDTVADNASSGAYVLGPPLQITGTDLADVPVQLLVGDREVATGMGVAALGHPATAAAWLVNRLAEFDVDLPPGAVILTGSLHASVPLHRGDHVVARFAGFGAVRLDVE